MMTEEERIQRIRLRTAEIRKHDQKQNSFWEILDVWQPVLQ